jgi:hypothetical protein
LRNILGAARRGPFEEHVLDKMRDAALRLRLVTRAPGKPDTNADRPYVRHPFSKKSETIRKHVADDQWLRHGCVGVEVSVRQHLATLCRKLLTDRELEELAHDNTRVNCAARKLSRISSDC